MRKPWAEADDNRRIAVDSVYQFVVAERLHRLRCCLFAFGKNQAQIRRNAPKD